MADLPHTVRRFLAEHINSVEQLEVLLRMRDEPGRLWTAEEMAQALSTSPSSVQIRLADLESARLVSRDADGYRYAPGDELRATLDDVADCYGKYRVRVISEIFSQPSEGVRSFSDAFRLREDR